MANILSIQGKVTGINESVQAQEKALKPLNIQANVKLNEGSLGKLSQPLGRVTGLATEFEKSIAASNARVIAFGASVGIINGIQNAFASLVTTTIEVQKSLAQIGAVSGKSGDELNRFGDSLFELAKNTGQSFKIASEAAVEFSRQGLSLQETLSRTNDALTLTRFTSLSAADAVDVLTAAVNSFGSSGLTTSEILNKLVAVDSEFAVSAADLANGLSRAGSIAQDVGVSFDELNGIITAVQERTARGGAVIGNAFKSIFTRIRSEDTIQALQKIGISSVDAAGNVRPVVPILKELASTLNTLSGTEKIQALEAVGSKYNINILNALLQDLNSAESQFDKSKTTSSNASSEAYQRQIELNKSLDAIINSVSVSTDKLANSIGRIGVSDNLKGLLNFFGDLVSSINSVIDSEGIGGNIAKGLISGLGGVFFKVGIPVLTALFVILTKNIIQFGAESLQTILGLNSKVKEREALEQAVYNTLISNESVMQRMNSLAGDRKAQEKALLKIYNDQEIALKKVRDISVALAPAIQTGGFSATSGKLVKKGSSGYLPAQEAADVSRGVGGASPSSKVVSIPNFAFGGGKKGTMIANTSEYIVPNYANGGSAIFNQDMIKSFGVPAGAKKLGAAGGYVPNFANEIGVRPASTIAGDDFEERVRDYLGVPDTRGSNAIFDFYPGDLDKAPQDKKNALGVKGSWGDLKLNFNEYARKSILAKLINGNQDTAPDKIIKATKANRQSISLNETSQIDGATLFYKAFDNNPKQGQSEVKQTLGTILKEGKQSPKLLSLFDEIRTDPGAEKKVGLLKNNAGKKMSSIMVRANLEENAIIDPESFQTGAASLGYIPNFADPLKAAVEREMAAGLDPSQIRITKDARLKNGKNPEGFAVINTRDEPDGKIPNFVNDKPILGSGMFGSNRQEGRAAQKELDSMKAQKKAAESSDIFANAQNVLIKEIILKQIAYKNGSIIEKELIDSTKSLAETYKLGADAQKKVITGSEDYISKIKSSPAANIKNLPFPSLEGVPVSKTGKANKEPQEFNPTKFFALQAAAVGATSAMQSLAKEGSGAAMSLEAAGGVLGTVFTGLSFIGTKINPLVAVISVATSAFANLAPVISKYISSLETEGERFSKQLKELGDQAKKTGQELTAEKILGLLGDAKTKGEEAKEQQSLELQVLNQANSLGVTSSSGDANGLSESEIQNILNVLRAMGGVEGVGIDKKINKDILTSFLTQSTKLQTIPSPELGEELKVRKFDLNAFREVSRRPLEEVVAKAKKRAETNIDLRESGGVRELQKREVILARQAEQEFLINDAYQRRINTLDEESKKLRENNSILTEKQKIEKELINSQQRINAEAKKERELSILSVRTSLQKAKEQGSLVSYKPLVKNSPFINRESYDQESNFNIKSILNSDFSRPSSVARKGSISALENPFVNNRKIPIPRYGDDLGKDAKGPLENLSDDTIKQILSKINQGEGQQAAASLIPGFAKASIESQTKVLDSLKPAAESLRKADIGEANRLFKAAIEKAIPQTDKNAKEIEGLNSIIANSTQANELYAQNVELAAQKYEIDAKNKAISARIEVDNMAKNAKVDDELTAFKKVTLEQYKTGYTEDVKRANIAKKLTDAEDALVRSENDKNENNKVDVALTRQRFGAERNEIRRKITIQDAYNSQISQLALDQKVADELRLEKSSLIDATRKLTAQYNNLAAVTENEKTKISNQLGSEIISTISKGDAYSGTSINLREQAKASVLKQNLKGKEFKDLSLEERSNLTTGKANTIGQNLRIEGSGLLDEAKTFQQILGQDTPKALADGLTEAMKVGLSGADNIGEALQNVAKSFLQTIQSAMLESASKNIVGSFTAAIGGSQGGYVKKFATGGMVTGGSGIRDDVPAMLSAGEYVMRKSAVQKYGAENIAKMNDGGIFLPGVRGGSAISGYDQLSKFANQTTTSGATDILQGTGSTAYANLEDQSSRLSRFGLMNEDTIKGEVTSAQQQGLDLIAKREAYRTQQRKAMQQQIISTVASIAVAYGAGKLRSAMKTKPTTKLDYGQNNFKGGIENLNNTVLNNQGLANAIPNDKFESLYFNSAPRVGVGNAIGYRGGAYGGMIAGFNNGGGPTDDIPALLMGGEYVMNRATTRKYGKQYLDSMNTGRARFADGGEVGMDATVESSDSKAKVDSKTGTAVNISINVSGSSSSTESQGQTSQGGVDYKKMGERIKAVVLETINEEKRLGGALRSR